MPTAAGILDIIAGVFRLMGGLVLAILGTVGGGVLRFFEIGTPGIPFMLPKLLVIVAVPLIVLGILAIVGGIYALQRKVWGLALAGSICALLFSSFLGIPAIIFTALSKKEFE